MRPFKEGVEAGKVGGILIMPGLCEILFEDFKQRSCIIWFPVSDDHCAVQKMDYEGAKLRQRDPL